MNFNGVMDFCADHWEIVTGITGWIAGICGFLWNRKESRLQALEGALRPLLQAAQALKAANDCLRAADAIRRSFPEPDKTPNATAVHNAKVEEYQKWIEEAASAAKCLEREYGATCFRFPDRVARLLGTAHEDIVQAGKHLNDGHTELVDVQIAKALDQYSTIRKYARGYRLYDPFEGVLAHIREKRQTRLPEQADEWLTKEEINDISMLAWNRLTKYAGQSYQVHPPAALIENPSLIESDDVVEKLTDSVFQVVFQDGTQHLMGLPHLLLFTYLILAMADEGEKIAKAADIMQSPLRVSVTYRIAPAIIMGPSMAKVLLSKVQFSSQPADA